MIYFICKDNFYILDDIFLFYVTEFVKMIVCHLSRIMGERKLKIADIERETGLHRNTVTLLYKETATRVDLDTIDKLCKYFKCSVSDLFEYFPNENTKSKE